MVRLVALVLTALLTAGCATSATGAGRLSGAPDPVPQRLADLDRGPTTNALWAEARGLEVVSANGITLVGQSHWRRGSSWARIVDGQPVPFARSRGLLVPVLSADGRYAAWSSWLSEHRRRVVLWDVWADREVGRTERRVEVACCTGDGDLHLQGVDEDGHVYWSVWGDTVRWTPGSEAIRVRGAESTPWVPLWPRGLMYQGGGLRRAPGVFGSVGDDGRFTEVGRVPSAYGVWSPGGSAYAYWGDERGRWSKSDATVLWVRHLDGRRVRTELPVTGELVTWDSPALVVVKVRNCYVRCDASNGTCERAGS